MENLLKSPSATCFLFMVFSLSVLGKSKNDIPDTVEKTFESRYPTAQNVVWQQYLKDEYLATFILDDEEANVFISDKGEFIESHVQLDESHMPKKILDVLSKIPNGGDVHYILNTVTSKDFQFYRAKVKIDNKHYEFLFDQYQTLISVKPIVSAKIL
jgi:hypothetical protein